MCTRKVGGMEKRDFRFAQVEFGACGRIGMLEGCCISMASGEM